jgi:pteridine reductase
MADDRGVALVTGAGKRVGRAIALELAASGYDVAVHCHRSRTEAEEVARKIEALRRRACVVQGDLAEESSWPRLIDASTEALGRLDVLVNNASVFDAMRLDDFDATAWERTFRVNLTAVAGMCHHAAAQLRAGGRGCIVNLCDIAAERPFGKHLAYSCAKAGVVALTKALAVALAPQIRVNAVAPGIAVFPESYDAAPRARLTAEVPLQRAGTPEDVAGAVRYLVDDAPYVTGQILRVDGGRSVRW